jgi:hypothetical protein
MNKRNKNMKFTEVLKDIISEDVRSELFLKKFTEPTKDKKTGQKVNPVLTADELFELIKNDPTSRVPEGATGVQDVKKTGGYVQWMINQIKRLRPTGVGKPNAEVELFFEDLYKVKDDLVKFERFKGQLPEDKRDINKLTSDELYELVKDFSLEKATTTKAERKDAKYNHPGGEFVLETPKYVVTKIERQDELGKEAACFYGGNNKETRWCTSAPGLTYFERYIKDGPLYQVFDKESSVSPETGLPSDRFQFHFPSNQFMDKHDRQIDLIEFLNQSGDEIKTYFKPEFMKGLLSQTSGGKTIEVEFPRSSAAKFIALYGFDEFFETIPDDVTRLDISGPGSSAFKLPEAIGRLKNLTGIHIDGLVSEIPNSICNLKNLRYLSLPNNKQLKTLPLCMKDLPNLKLINYKGSDSLKIPEEITSKVKAWG